jgi:hypothetical protein
MDLAKAAEQVEELARVLEDGEVSMSGKLVMARLVVPFREVMKRLNDLKAGRWLLLQECMRKTGCKRPYFDKPLVSLGGRSRLEKWREEGSAEQSEEGVWLVNPAVLPDLREDTPRKRAPEDRSGRVEVNNIINSLLK